MNTRYNSLDHWRGIACLMVVYSHAVPWHSDFGGIGVGIFFAISGYCITAAVKSNRERQEGIITFARRRATRIYPPYWCALLLVMGIAFCTQGYFEKPINNYGRLWSVPCIVGNLTLTEGWRQHFFGPETNWLIGPSWSLGLEEQFYAICGLSLLLSWRAFLPLVVALCGATLVLSVAHERDLINISGFFFNHFWLGFAAGVFVFFGVHGTRFQRAISIAGLGAGVAFALVTRFSSPGLSSAVVFAAVAFLLYRWDSVISSSANPVLRFLRWSGTISYSLYLTHDIWGQVSMRVAAQSGFAPSFARETTVVIATYVVSLLFAWPFHRYCEKPFIPSRKASARSASQIPALAAE